MIDLRCLIPFLGVRKYPLNRDLSEVDTGKANLFDEVGYYYNRILSIEWLFWGKVIRHLDHGQLRYTSNDQLVPFEEIASIRGEPS